MIVLVIFLSLSIAIFIVHSNRQKKSLLLHHDITTSLQMQLNSEHQRNKSLRNVVNKNFNKQVDFKLDILSQQVQLLEIISNQTN